MYGNKSSPDFWKLSAQQQVGLDKHQQRVQDALQWQEASKSVDDQPKALVNVLDVLRTALLRWKRNWTPSKPEPAHLQQGLR